MHPLLYCAIISGGCSLLILLALLSRETERQVAARRLVEMTRERPQASTLASPASSTVPPVRTSSHFKHLQEFIHRLPLGFLSNAALPSRLASAGFRDATAPGIFLLARVAVPLLAGLFAAFIPWHRGFFLVVLPAIGYLVPDLVLRRLIKRRRRVIRLSLPDAIDLMVICVEAGLGLDQALYRVSRELILSHPELTEELAILNLEQRAGKPRMQAWQAMAARLQIAELDGFLNMLIQTDRFGTPIGRALSHFSETLRERRRQAAEEKAAKTNVKIILPLAIFIFPSIFVILLGPAVLTLLRNLPMIGH